MHGPIYLFRTKKSKHGGTTCQKPPKSSVWDFFGTKPDERGKAAAVQGTAAAKDSNTTNSHEHLSVRRPAEYARLSPAFHQQAQEKLFTSRISKVLLLKRLNMKRTAPGGHSAR